MKSLTQAAEEGYQRADALGSRQVTKVLQAALSLGSGQVHNRILRVAHLGHSDGIGALTACDPYWRSLNNLGVRADGFLQHGLFKEQ